MVVKWYVKYAFRLFVGGSINKLERFSFVFEVGEIKTETSTIRNF
jgi:hypothetical protein